MVRSSLNCILNNDGSKVPKCAQKGYEFIKPRISKARAAKAIKPLKRGEIALLRGNHKRVQQITEFMDKDHAAMDEYYEVTEQFQAQQVMLKETKEVLQKLIKIDKHFLDSYLYLAQIEYDEENYEEYFRLVWKAYLKAIDLVANADGDYPKSLPWGWLENRHIVRALCNFALMQWEQDHIRVSLEIYRKLLASNLNDNVGARYSILAILLGYSSDYEALFLHESGPVYGLDAKKMDNWFNANAQKFSNEFVDFFNNAKQYE